MMAIALLAAAVVVLALFLARARAQARVQARRFEVLEEIATVADRGGSVEETLAAISKVLVPAVADFCMIDVISAAMAFCRFWKRTVCSRPVCSMRWII